MALLADRLAEVILQVPGIDNGVLLAGGLRFLFVAAHVQLAGTMTALTTNGSFAEERQWITIGRIFHVLHRIGMAKEAVRPDRPAEVGVVRGIAGRQLPDASLRIPADRRLKEIAIVVDHIRTPPFSRADDEPDLGFPLDHAPSGGVERAF